MSTPVSTPEVRRTSRAKQDKLRSRLEWRQRLTRGAAELNN
jgi:hypothetical protein